MRSRWIHAGGTLQLPFMTAAARALRGQLAPCPKCSAELRAYFHVFNVKEKKGTIWLWCGACHLHTHLPRTRPQVAFQDPFAELSLDEFAALELDSGQPLLDRLEALWTTGQLKIETP
jgi:hypothetical protein